VYGDGATAVVVGRVEAPYGLLASVHRTDSDAAAARSGNTSGPWWRGDHRPLLHTPPPELVRRQLTRSALATAELTGRALADAALAPQDISFFASSQPAPWFRRVTQALAGVPSARACDSYPTTGDLGPANVPLLLAEGERRGLLNDGDLLLTYASDEGVSAHAAVLRWGGRRAE
jgi:3-oxoacyl-[acyl-carrier-protein] synthase-3